MKKIFILFMIAACQSVAVFAQDNQTPYLTKSLSADAISSVVVNTTAGGIQVSGESGQSPRIEVYIRGNHNRELSKEEIKKRLDEDYDMNITVSGHELNATVKNKHRNGNWDDNISISFKIYVPENVSTDLHTSGGGISLDHLKGNETFNTSGGGLAINALSGVIRGKTSGGGIEVSNSSEDIDLRTSGGGIEAKNCSGTIFLETSGGGLKLEDLKGKINAHTSGGGIEGRRIDGELITGTSAGGISIREMDGSLEATTSAGGLDVEMNHVSKYIKLEANAGNINLRLPSKQGFALNLTAKKINDKVSGFSGDWTKTSVNGNVNGGEIPVTAHSDDRLDIDFN